MAGMCPEAVLTDEQKKFRYQRLIRKRKLLSSGIVGHQGFVQVGHLKQRSKSDPLDPIYSKMPKLDPIKRQVTEPKLPIKLIISKRELSTTEYTTEPENRNQRSQNSKDATNICCGGKYSKQSEKEKWPRFLEAKIELLFQSYKDSCFGLFCQNSTKKDANTFNPKKETLEAYSEHRKQFEKFVNLQRFFDLFFTSFNAAIL